MFSFPAFRTVPAYFPALILPPALSSLHVFSPFVLHSFNPSLLPPALCTLHAFPPGGIDGSFSRYCHRLYFLLSFLFFSWLDMVDLFGFSLPIDCSNGPALLCLGGSNPRSLLCRGWSWMTWIWGSGPINGRCRPLDWGSCRWLTDTQSNQVWNKFWFHTLLSNYWFCCLENQSFESIDLSPLNSTFYSGMFSFLAFA